MDELSFTIADILLALVVLVSAAYATWRGLMRETLSIFSWAVSAYVTLRFFPTFRPMLREFIATDWLSDLLVFVGLFVIMVVPLSVISYRFSETVKKSEISSVDRALGLLFGVGRGFVIVGLLYIVFAAVTQRNDPEWLTRSQTYPLVLTASDLLLELVPEQRGLSASDFGIAPVAAAPEPQEADGGPNYGAGERRELDRLIEATGGQ